MLHEFAVQDAKRRPVDTGRRLKITPLGSVGRSGGHRAIDGCHASSALNSGPGSVKILLPSGNSGTYTPGQSMQLLVQISDSTKSAYGFEMTARMGAELVASSHTRCQKGPSRMRRIWLVPVGAAADGA